MNENVRERQRSPLKSSSVFIYEEQVRCLATTLAQGAQSVGASVDCRSSTTRNSLAYSENKNESRLASAAWMSVALVVDRHGRIEESSYTVIQYRHWL